MIRFEIVARATKGGRPYQEDALCAEDVAGRKLENLETAPAVMVERGCLVLVADGVGGEYGGNIASATLCDRFPLHFGETRGAVEQRLVKALDAANADIAARKAEERQLRHMASTLLVGIFDERSLSFLSVGDSPIYRLRDGEVHRINADHRHDVSVDLAAARRTLRDRASGRKSDADDLFSDPWEVALQDRQRAAITSAVTGETISETHIATSALKNGDVVIFASDGIELLSLEHLRSFAMSFLAEDGLTALADALIDTVDRHGKAFTGNSHDNTSFIIVRVLRDDGETTSLDAATLVPEEMSVESTGTLVSPAAVERRAPAATPLRSSEERTAAPPERKGSSGKALLVIALVAGLALGGAAAWFTGVFSAGAGGTVAPETASPLAPNREETPRVLNTPTTAPASEPQTGTTSTSPGAGTGNAGNALPSEYGPPENPASSAPATNPARGTSGNETGTSTAPVINNAPVNSPPVQFEIRRVPNG